MAGKGGDKLVVFVTCGSAEEASRIARSVVDARMAACVNILGSPVESIYRWKGSVENAKEFLLIMKTTGARFEGLRRLIKTLHSYEVPEIIAIPIAAGSPDYLSWLETTLGPTREKPQKRKRAPRGRRRARRGR
jgi:periplasmic divalent cation tolerance protein